MEDISILDFINGLKNESILQEVCNQVYSKLVNKELLQVGNEKKTKHNKININELKRLIQLSNKFNFI